MHQKIIVKIKQYSGYESDWETLKCETLYYIAKIRLFMFIKLRKIKSLITKLFNSL